MCWPRTRRSRPACNLDFTVYKSLYCMSLFCHRPFVQEQRWNQRIFLLMDFLNIFKSDLVSRWTRENDIHPFGVYLILGGFSSNAVLVTQYLYTLARKMWMWIGWNPAGWNPSYPGSRRPLATADLLQSSFYNVIYMMCGLNIIFASVQSVYNISISFGSYWGKSTIKFLNAGSAESYKS